MKTYYVYMIECADKTLYTGMTDDILRRYRQHITKTGGCKYTRNNSRHPLKLVKCWSFSGDLSLALKVEKFIKKNSRIFKLRLINNLVDLKREFIKTNPIIVEIKEINIEEFEKAIINSME